MLNTFKLLDVTPRELEHTYMDLCRAILPDDWVKAFDHHQILAWADLVSRLGFCETGVDLGKRLGLKPSDASGVGTLMKSEGKTHFVWHDRDGFNLYTFPAYAPYNARWLLAILSTATCGFPALYRDFQRECCSDLVDFFVSAQSSVHVVAVLGPLGSVRRTGGPSV